jgi:hypothetical protein
MWTVTGGGGVAVVSNATASSTVSNSLKLPSTTANFTANVYETFPGGNVILTLSDTNNGQIPLTNAHVHLYANGVEVAGSPMFKASPYFVGGDTNSNGIMDMGETWTWQISVTINVTTMFTMVGHGTDPLGDPVEAPYPPGTPGYPNELRTLEVKVGGATRTQGFWATHLDFTTYVFTHFTPPDADNSTGYINLGYPLAGGNTANVTDMHKLMGIFWANNAKNSDSLKRTQLGQARETTANQALAAILNSAMPGGKP